MRELLKCHAGTKVPANPTLPAPALDVLYHPPNNDASLKKNPIQGDSKGLSKNSGGDQRHLVEQLLYTG